MPEYALLFRDRSTRPEMNGDKWEQLLAAYRGQFDYNTDRIWKNYFVISCKEEVAQQIRADHPELIVEQPGTAQNPVLILPPNRPPR